MKQQHSGNKIHSLDIPNLRLIIRERLEYPFETFFGARHLKVLDILESPFKVHGNVLINLLVVISDINVQLIHLVVAVVLVVVLFPSLF